MPQRTAPAKNDPLPGEVRPPPRRLSDRLRYLGPGMVIAAGLVGSGELIATTKAGAQAGIGLLWVILLGCVVKVFAQIEFGRYTISSGETTLTALNRLPGPRLGVNWIIWLWLVMMAATYGMLAGILAGVGQAMSMLPAPGGPAAGSVRGWAIGVACATALLLFLGRYRLLERLSIALVFCFTVITVGNAIALQTTDYAIPGEDLLQGLVFSWPDGSAGWLTALAAFGIIGIGGTDLVVYPYFCMERGYHAFIGPRSDDPAWAARARGWLRVMRTDAFASMLIYTATTAAFFFIGAAVLHRDGLDPDGMDMVATIAAAYVPVLGEYARVLFLAGALAVLYSSFLVANAGAARLLADCLRLFGLLQRADAMAGAIRALSAGLPLLVLLIFLTGWNPVRLVVIGGLTQSLVLPVLGASALYFRYRKIDPRLRPGRAWDVALVLSSISLLLAGLFSLVQILSR
ncbi:MAG: divalent metal cation transporter [Gammaproteobacteria bacterium]|nr:MAG: divalent metal cation transporter [Gammaproteobacteria bacterium]